METYTVADYVHATIPLCCVQTLAALRLTDTAGRIFQGCLEEEFRDKYWNVTSAAAIAVMKRGYYGAYVSPDFLTRSRDMEIDWLHEVRHSREVIPAGHAEA